MSRVRLSKEQWLDLAHQIAKERGGECLSTEYKNSESDLRWKCKEGHEWSVCLSQIKNKKTWCVDCYWERRRLPDGLDRAKRYAAERKGEVLSTKYKGGTAKLHWRCAEGHEWHGSYGDTVIPGTWCRECANISKLNRDGLSIAKKTALLRGGECLSIEYLGVHPQMEWKCALGHIWSGSYHSVITQGAWCKKCNSVEAAARLQTRFIEDAQGLAISKRGECLSQEMKGTKDVLEWKCEQGHVWHARFADVRPRFDNPGSWCPNCLYKTEQFVRQIFERLLKVPFPKRRPAFLKGLELDGYNEEIAVAFEFNGVQHYEYKPYFHKNGPEDLEEQKERDNRKEIICEDWVLLIIIPYDMPREKMEEWIRPQLTAIGCLD